MEFQFESTLLEEMQKALSVVIHRTPVLASKGFPGVWFKAENLQVTGSFKIRPAYGQLVHLDPAQRRRGIVTSSSGNFAQGVAYAAARLGINAKIVMMESARAVKVEATRRLGGEVVFCANRFAAREKTVRSIAEGEGRFIIHPFDHPHAILGNATAGAEIAEDLPGIKNLIAPISGGGLISGLALAIKLLSPRTKVWGVQPLGSNATYLSFQEGRRVAINESETIADGLMVTSPGKLTFPIIRKHLESVVTVSEESIVAATRHLLEHEKLVVEPSGAVPLAAILEEKVPSGGTVCFLSGGNIDPSFLSALFA